MDSKRISALMRGEVGNGNSADAPRREEKAGELPATVEEIAELDPEQLEELLPELEARADEAQEASRTAVEVVGAARLRVDAGFARSSTPAQEEGARG